MPTYDYQCSECGYMFEDFHSMKADPLRTCPNCHKDGLKRIMGGGAGMIFKGQGFYLTDYKKSGGNSKGDGKAKSSPKKTSSSEAPKSEPSKKEEKPSSSADKKP